MLKAIIALLISLPEIIELIKSIQKQIDESFEDRKLKDDIKKINDAFKTRDPEALNRIFISGS
jgi:hypothetical protein